MELLLLSFAAFTTFSQSSAQGQTEIDLEFSILENVGRNAYVGNVALETNLQDRVPSEFDEALVFRIMDQNNEFEEYFYVNAQNGDLRTKTAIDRENIPGCSYQDSCIVDVRVVIVSESHDFAFFQIVDCHISVEDENDNAPSFTQSRVARTIPEDTPVASRINIPYADDPDSPQYGISHYELLSRSVPELRLVQVNESGDPIALYIEVVQPLDRETRPSYQVVVAAYDKGNKSAALTVDVNVIDVNDNAPRFTQDVYTVSVREDMSINDLVVQVTAIDEDADQNSELIYAFESRSQAAYGNLFSINNSTGEIVLISQLDYEATHQYILDITAKEKYHETLPIGARVIVEVVDVNDNAPVITVNAVTQSGHLEIVENAPVGTVIGLISTHDPDSGAGGEYSCALQNNQDDSFELTATSSARTDFKIETNSNFDREVKEQYDLKFVCTDRGSPNRESISIIRVTILDENDNAPIFSQPVYNVSVAENNAPGVFLMQVRATDLDFGQNGQVEFSLYAEAMTYISVDSVSGNVTANIAFDYERYHVLSFGVIARDKAAQAHTATAILNIYIINENDEPPVFARPAYDFEIAENSGAMASIDQVEIEEREEGLSGVIYVIEEPSLYSDLFLVEPDTGIILARSNFDADTSPSNVYQFHVLAIDFEHSNLRSRASVSVRILDRNDNAPIILFPGPLNNTLHIGNDLRSGDIVANIIASDKDVDTNYNSNLRYIIEAGGTTEYFRCNEHSGEVRTIRDFHDIDAKVFILNITVQDMGTPPLLNTTTLIIAVNQSLSASAKKKTERLVQSDNLTIVVSVTVTSTILILILIGAIVIIKRTDKIKLYNKRQRIVKLFSSQKVNGNPANHTTPSLYSLDGVKVASDDSGSDVMQIKQQQKQYTSEKNYKVTPWLMAHINMEESADGSNLSDQSLASDSGRGSHDEVDQSKQSNEATQHLDTPPPRGRHTPHDPHNAPPIPPKRLVYHSGPTHCQPPYVPERRQAHGRTRRDSGDRHVQRQPAVHIAPDHKLLYRQRVASPSVSTASQYSPAHNYSLSTPTPGEPFVHSASYI